MKIALNIILASILFQIGYGQNVLTLEDATTQTMNNNFGIKIARQNVAIAKNNTDRSLLGYNPTVNLNGGVNSNLGGSNQKFFNGNENTVSNALSLGGNASLDAAYTLFDQSRSANLDQLQEQVNQASLQVRQSVETNVLQLIGSYYEIARLSRTLTLLEQTLSVSRERIERSQYQYEYGQGLKVNVLNAEVDLQRDSVNIVNTALQLTNAKRNLNVIMGTELNSLFEVDTQVNYGVFDIDDLENSMLSNNIDLLINEKENLINDLNLDIIESERVPRISAVGSYGINLQRNPSGAFITNSSSRGLNIGLNLNWNILDGGVRKTRTQIVELNKQTIQLDREQLVIQLRRDLYNTWENYQTALFIIQTERVNVQTAELNFEQTEERYALGQLTSVDFRQAQVNLLNAQISLNNARYDAKAIEASLLQLAGRLLAN